MGDLLCYWAQKPNKTQRQPPKMMTKTDTSKPVQSDPFKVMLRDLVAKGHELVLLRDAIDW